MDNWGAFISLIAAISGIILGWVARARTVKRDAINDVTGEVVMKQDIKYIKQGVDEIKKELHCQADDIGKLSERVTRVEESSKQAHKRIDKLEGIADKR